MRIRQKAYVKHQIRIFRNPMPEPETHARNQNVIARLLLLEALRDMRSQFVDVELRSIDYQIRHGPNAPQMLTLGGQRWLPRGFGAQRMRTPGLTETAQQHRIGGL